MDDLMGLKENVIVGRLIPAGTGRLLQQLRRAELARDVTIGGEELPAGA
jgi:DNA-directed RNA polymerase subunit beta'